MRPAGIAFCLVAAIGCGGDDGGVGGGGGGDGDGDGDGDGVASVEIQVVEQHVTDPELRNGSAIALVTPFSSGDPFACQVTFESGDCRVLATVQPMCETGCAKGEVCILDPDSGCAPTCVPGCTLECADDQYCHRADDGSMSCEPREPYEAAGDIALSGLAQPVSLAGPTYQAAIIQGPVFDGGAVTASASGATSAGVTGFDIDLEPPPEVVATPPLASLTQEDFASDLSLSWSPGSDDIQVEMFAGARRIVCDSDDDGDLVIPVEVLDTIPATAQAVRIDLERVRAVTSDAPSGFGTYLGRDIPATAEVELRLSRRETATIPFL